MPAAGAAAPKARAAKAKAPFGRYIVMLQPSFGDPEAVAQDQTARPGASVEGIFRTLKGYAATFRNQDIEAVRRNPRTELIARDDTVRAMDVVSQSPAPFGVDRVDQRFRPLDNTFQANNGGDGVHVYVLDTRIRASHPEFGGRVLPGPPTATSSSPVEVGRAKCSEPQDLTDLGKVAGASTSNKPVRNGHMVQPPAEGG